MISMSPIASVHGYTSSFWDSSLLLIKGSASLPVSPSDLVCSSISSYVLLWSWSSDSLLRTGSVFLVLTSEKVRRWFPRLYPCCLILHCQRPMIHCTNPKMRIRRHLLYLKFGRIVARRRSLYAPTALKTTCARSLVLFRHFFILQ